MNDFFVVKGQKFDVMFENMSERGINDFQRQCYSFVEGNIKNLYKTALKSIKKHIKTKEFHDVYISDFGITEKEIFKSISFSSIYFSQYEEKGFGFLGSWEADIEHGLGVRFCLNNDGAELVEIEGQDCLIQ